MIRIEKVIGGHTYRLEETKAPDGYECTAVVTFHVKTDGTIDTISSSGGYRTAADGACASLDEARTAVEIRDEKIRMSLTKVDYSDAAVKLDGVTFTLTPYGTVTEGADKGKPSSFTENELKTPGITYNEQTKQYLYTAVTDAEGIIHFPDGLLKSYHSYLLHETATREGYYLGHEAKDGVILTVGKDGSIAVSRLDCYQGKTITTDGKTESSCPVTVQDTDGSSDLLSKNMQAAAFELTKKVDGNMGDLSGVFQITLEVYEPDGTEVGKRVISLKLNEKYDSVTGLEHAVTEEEKQAFGANAIPVGATLVIKEEKDLDYTAVVRIVSEDGTGTVLTKENADKGTAKVTLNTSARVSIELTNRKEVILDVGVRLENHAPLAALALLIPAVWLAYRYRRKRRGGE